MSFSTSVLRKTHRCKVPYLLLLFLILLGVCVVYFSSTGDDASISTWNNWRTSEKHVLCMLVPFRDRFEELLVFVPYISKFLNRQSIAYHIIIANHLPDGYRFNRGSLLNAAFLTSRKKFPECDYIALQDIDTLPLTDEVSYAHPGEDAYHAIPLGYHPVRIYSHYTYIGGILLMSNEVFSRMNGYGNNFWGSGLGDTDFQRRMVKHSVRINRPESFSAGRNNSFKHIHGESKQRDWFRCRNQEAAANSRDRTDHTGLSDVNFTIAAETNLIIEGFPCYVLNINIRCVFEITPWCRPFCIDNITKPKTIFDFEGDIVWPENWKNDPDLDSKSNANFLLWMMNRNKNTNL